MIFTKVTRIEIKISQKYFYDLLEEYSELD